MKSVIRYISMLSLVVFVFSSILIFVQAEEEAPKLILSCDGKFEHNRTEHFAVLEKNVKLSYADVRLACQFLRIDFEDDDTTLKSVEARGYLDDDDLQQKATGRLQMDWKGIRLTSRTAVGSFHLGTELLKQVSADGDVWLKLEEKGYTAHSGHLGLSFDADGVTTTALLRPDAAVTKVELGGNGYVATEAEGSIIYAKNLFTHYGKDIEIIYDLVAGRTILPDNLKEHQADKLTVTATAFEIFPFANRFKFSDGVKVRFGEIILKSDSLDLETTTDNKLPRRIVTTRGKFLCDMSFKDMTLKAGTFDVNFDAKGGLVAFNALEDVDIVVVDAANREIRAQSIRATYAPDVVSLIGDPWVHIQIPSEKTRIREKKCEFFLQGERWEHRGEGIEIEASPDGMKK